MHCRYQIEEAAIKSIQDIDIAKIIIATYKRRYAVACRKSTLI
jgi:hypothetical protein